MVLFVRDHRGLLPALSSRPPAMPCHLVALLSVYYYSVHCCGGLLLLTPQVWTRSAHVSTVLHFRLVPQQPAHSFSTSPLPHPVSLLCLPAHVSDVSWLHSALYPLQPRYHTTSTSARYPEPQLNDGHGMAAFPWITPWRTPSCDGAMLTVNHVASCHTGACDWNQWNGSVLAAAAPTTSCKHTPAAATFIHACALERKCRDLDCQGHVLTCRQQCTSYRRTARQHKLLAYKCTRDAVQQKSSLQPHSCTSVQAIRRSEAYLQTRTHVRLP